MPPALISRQAVADSGNMASALLLPAHWYAEEWWQIEYLIPLPQLGLAVNAAFEAAALRSKAPTIEQLADSLRSQNYDVRIRTALGGGGNQECLRNLRHRFLTLNVTGGRLAPIGLHNQTEA